MDLCCFKEMSFVDHYLPYFRQQLIGCPSAFPAFVYWKFTWRLAPCLSRPSPVHLQHPTPSAVCLFSVSCLLFSFLFVLFFVEWGGWVYPGCCAGLLQGLLGEYYMILGAHLLVCWISPKQVWSCCLAAWEPSCFLSVTLYGEALYRLRVQGVKVLVLLGALFPPSVALVCLQDFWLMELTLSASAS
jgi:hypothetical protein